MTKPLQVCNLFLFCFAYLNIFNLSAQVTKTNINLSEDFQVLYSADYSANITVKIKVLKKSCPEGSNLWVLYDGYLSDKDLYIKFKINYIDCDNVKRYKMVSLPIGKRNLDFSDIWGDKGKNKNIFKKLDNNASILGIVGNSHDIDFTYFPGIELGFISDIELSSQYIAENKKVDALEPASYVEVINANGSNNNYGSKAQYGSTVSLKPIGGNLIPNSNWVWYKSNSVSQPPLSNSFYTGNTLKLNITDSTEYIDLYVRAEGPNNIRTSFTKVQIWIDYSQILLEKANYLFSMGEIEKAKMFYQNILNKSFYKSQYIIDQIQLCDNYLNAQKEYRYSETYNNSNLFIEIDIANLLELEAGKTEKGNINCTLNFQATNQDKKEFTIQANDPKFKYYERFGVQRWLAYELSQRFIALMSMRSVAQQLLEFAETKLPEIIGANATFQVAQAHRERLGLVREALHALELQYPTYSLWLQERYLGRIARGLEREKYAEMLEQSLVSGEVYADLLEKADVRWAFLEQERSLDIEMSAVALVARVPLLSELPAQALSEVTKMLTPRLFLPDQLIWGEQLPPFGLYIVASGAVLVLLPDGTHAELGSGEFFGELALLSAKKVEGFEVRSLGYSKVLCLPAKSFNDLLARNAGLKEKIERVAQQRLRAIQVWRDYQAK
jgi:CRP-like cAMP-binding protein